MSMSKIAMRIRGLFAENYSEAREDVQVVGNSRGDQQVALSMPGLSDLARLGGTYQVALSTGLAALTALPTTTGGLSLWNGESAGGKSYIIEAFGSWEGVVDATQTDVTAIFAMMNKTPVTAPTDAALAIRSTTGRSSYGGKARTASALAVTNDGWFAHPTSGQMAAAAAGANWKVNDVNPNGIYIVPPGGMFNVQGVKAAAAAAAQQFFYVRWHEVQIIVVT